VGKHGVKRHDALPVGVLDRYRPGVAGGDLGLHRVRPGCEIEPLGTVQGGQTVPD
jgi:hypothetical protein